MSRRSLNRDYRKRELLKITQENQVILKRLQFSQSRYNVQRWVDEHKKKESILKNICEFPIVINHNPKPFTAADTNSQRMSHRSVSVPQYANMSPVESYNLRGSFLERKFPNNGFNDINDKSQNKLINIHRINKKPIQTDFIQKQADFLDPNRVVHFKKGKYIKQGYYIIEISSNGLFLFIAAFDVESPQSFLITIPRAKAEDIIQMFQENFEYMAEHLRVVSNKLVLLNPKYNKVPNESMNQNISSSEFKVRQHQQDASNDKVQNQDLNEHSEDEKNLGIYNDDEKQEPL